MKRNWIIGALVGVGILAAYAYYNGIARLTFGVSKANNFNITAAGVSFDLTIQVTNPSRWTYPVPVATMNFYSGTALLGTGISTAIQGIASGVSYLVFRVNVATQDAATLLITDVSTILSGGNPSIEITYDGVVEVANYAVPISGQIL